METARVVSQPDTVVCRAGYSLDFRTAEAFKQNWERLMEMNIRNFIIDFSATTVLDSAGLGAILMLHRRLKTAGGRVLFAAPSASVRTVLSITKCDRVFGTFPSVHAAVASLNSPAATPVKAPVAA